MGEHEGAPRFVGQLAPTFTLPSIQGSMVDLAAFRDRCRVVLWFSRGFQCPFCRGYMDRIAAGYARLTAQAIEVIQIAPNLTESAQTFFGSSPPPFPFVCDPDKRLFARYGLGDRGVLEATRSTIISLAHAADVGESGQTARAIWLDTANRNFLRRLHHHALTALEQGLFIVDDRGVIRYQVAMGTLDPVPDADGLRQLVAQVA